MGDETVTDSAYLYVNLGNKGQVPGVLCAPLGAREEPLIPITDHGDERRLGAPKLPPRKITQKSRASPLLVMRRRLPLG